MVSGSRWSERLSNARSSCCWCQRHSTKRKSANSVWRFPRAARGGSRGRHVEVPAGRLTFAHARASPSPARATAPGGRGPCSLFFARLKASSPELGTWQVPRAYLSADLPVKRPMLPSGGCGNRCALKRAQFPEREADQVCAGHKLVGRKQPFSLRVQLSEACHRETDVARPQCLSAPQGAGSPGERGATAGGRPG